MKKSLHFIYLLLTISVSCYSQFSKTHYIPPVSNASSQQPQGQYIYISCPSLTPVSFTIQEIGGISIPGTVSRDSPYVYSIGSGYNTQLLIDSSEVNTVKNNKGYIVEALDLIYVTVRLTSTPDHYQAGGLVSKGTAALGKQFRIGAFLNTNPPQTTENHYTFATILATENNTTISFEDIKPGAVLINNAIAGSSPDPIFLNAGESFAIAVDGTTNANRDALIGALIKSDKPIAVNCGSFAGSNADTSNLDLGFDQIVDSERIGTEYIFIRGNGFDVTEKPFIIAHEALTEVYIGNNGPPFPPDYVLVNKGDYLALDGTAFSATGNLYIKTSKPVFAYQAIGSVDGNGSPNLANQNLHFLPPLSCQTPRIINNIPLINEVGNITNFAGTVCIVTKTVATLDFIINGDNYSLASLPANVTTNGPFAVDGNPDYVTYTFQGLTGNISVISSKQVYLSYYGSSGFATYGGFYSGFTFKPELSFIEIDVAQDNCIPNLKLQVNEVSGFNQYQWYLNNTAITGATNYYHFPSQPGIYKVKATLTECGLDYFSDEIPISNCTSNGDNDLVNDNLDQDYDNDGITNCEESLGDLDIDITNPAAGNFSLGTFSNSFTGVITNSVPASPTPFSGNSDGSFVTETLAGNGYFVNYKMSFLQPQNIKLEYVELAAISNLINPDAQFIVSSDINKTISVVNPDNQLLIDTNYDGVYESNITQFTSFEIRFKVNGTQPLVAGTGTFQFLAYQAISLSITHKNTLDTAGNKATFKISASCIANDTDSDGIPDQLDYDNDNDGIPDLVESQGVNFTLLTNLDTNLDGIDNAFSNTFITVDTDSDSVPDYIDLDSDNDGIFDLVESGSNAPDTNFNGTIDGANFGANGLQNSLETSVDSGVLNYTLANSDTDTVTNYLDLDSDNDGCTDVIEAGFTDPNFDGLLGDSPISVNANGNGTVTSASAYTTPLVNTTAGLPYYIFYDAINIDLTDTALVCINLPLEFVTLDAGINDGAPITDYTYQWFFNGDEIVGQTNYTTNINTSGIYTVQVTNSFGCSRIRTITVDESDIAHIQNIEIIDLVDINTIEVIVTGPGNYVYSLDYDFDSDYQTSNFFPNVPIGFHTIYIKDLFECGTISEQIAVLGAPKYFTPNGDGINDIWNIKGVNENFNSQSIIYIFNRFGKLIHQIDTSTGWNGTLNGQPLPADDYWFTAKFEDGRSAKGHFSLKR